MKKGWDKITLGDILEPVARFEERDELETYQFAGTYSYARGIFRGDLKPGSSFSLPKIQRIQSGDFIYCKIMAWEGAFGLAGDDVHDCVMSGAFVAFRPDLKKVIPRYLHYWFKTETNWRSVSASSTGTNVRRKSLHPDDFRKSPIALPPLTEQQRIVAHLDAIEARLAQVQKLREEQEQQLLAALRSTFHKIESESEWIALGEVAPLVRREVEIDPTASYTEYGIKSFFKGIFLRRKMKGEEYSWQQLFWLKKGDVVFSNIMAWEKAIGFASPEADGWVGNHRMLVCEPRQEQVVSEWLYFYFTTAKGFAEILKASPGTAARNKTLKASSLLTIPVPIPSLDKQFEFKRLMDLRLAIQRKTRSTNERISALLPSLLDRVFNG